MKEQQQDHIGVQDVLLSSSIASIEISPSFVLSPIVKNFGLLAFGIYDFTENN